MGMLDDLEKMMMLEQMQGQQQGQGSDPFSQQQPMQPSQNMMQGSPLEKGSMMAVQSARESIAAKKRMLEMDDTERQRALGRAILTMRDSMNNNPSYGTGTMANISAMLSGAADGMMSYNQEGERIANANNVLLSQQKQEDMLARKEELQMKRMNHEMEIANKKLKLDQGYFGLKKQEIEDELKQHEAISKSGAKIPLSTLGKNQWGAAQKDIKDYLHLGDSARNTLHSIQGAKKILKDDPGITKNMAVIMLAAQRNDPTIVRQQLNGWLISEKTRKNAEMLSKYLSNLYTSKLPGFSARGMNMFLEKRLADGSVDINMLPASALELLDADEKVAKHHYKNGQDVYKEYEKGNFYRPPPMKFDEDEEVLEGGPVKGNDIEEFKQLLKALKESKE